MIAKVRRRWSSFVSVSGSTAMMKTPYSPARLGEGGIVRPFVAHGRSRDARSHPRSPARRRRVRHRAHRRHSERALLLDALDELPDELRLAGAVDGGARE